MSTEAVRQDRYALGQVYALSYRLRISVFNEIDMLVRDLYVQSFDCYYMYYVHYNNIFIHTIYTTLLYGHTHLVTIQSLN